MATSERMGDGGPAFPRPYSDNLCSHFPDQQGMTLRDYFAAKAMSFVPGRAELNYTGPREWAAACYEMADAMLAERSQP